MKTDIRQFISKMSELEIVDSFNSIERYLLAEMQVNLSSFISLGIICNCSMILFLFTVRVNDVVHMDP